MVPGAQTRIMSTDQAISSRYNYFDTFDTSNTSWKLTSCANFFFVDCSGLVRLFGVRKRDGVISAEIASVIFLRETSAVKCSGLPEKDHQRR